MIHFPKQFQSIPNFSVPLDDESFIKIALVAGGCLICFLYWVQKQCRQIEGERVRVFDQFR
jgi:hypothetical protein